jgi:hypothetical protein
MGFTSLKRLSPILMSFHACVNITDEEEMHVSSILCHVSVRRTLKNGLSEEEKKHLAAHIKGY